MANDPHKGHDLLICSIPTLTIFIISFAVCLLVFITAIYLCYKLQSSIDCNYCFITISFFGMLASVLHSVFAASTILYECVICDSDGWCPYYSQKRKKKISEETHLNSRHRTRS
eukprot:377107_1